MPKHPTPAQSAASRANGARSRGPVTAEGLDRCRRATARHGLRGRFRLLPGEDAGAFERLRAAWHRRLRPADPGEAALVDARVALLWRGMRLDGLEERVLAALLGEAPGAGLPSLATVYRYRAALDGERRAIDRALARLEARRPAGSHDGPEPAAGPAAACGLSPTLHDRPEPRAATTEEGAGASSLHDGPEPPGGRIDPPPAQPGRTNRHDGPEPADPSPGETARRTNAHNGPGPVSGREAVPAQRAAGRARAAAHDRPEPPPGPGPSALRRARSRWLAGTALAALRLGPPRSGLRPSLPRALEQELERRALAP